MKTLRYIWRDLIIITSSALLWVALGAIVVRIVILLHRAVA